MAPTKLQPPRVRNMTIDGFQATLIPLKGKHARGRMLIVDRDVAEWLHADYANPWALYKDRCDSREYVGGALRPAGTKQRSGVVNERVTLARMIMGAKPGSQMETILDDLSGGAAVLPIDYVSADAVAAAAEPHGPLTTHTMASMREFFDAADHRPNDEHWAALAAIASTTERMAEGRCESRVFLSAVDPGVGKSQTVLHFARALLNSPEHRTVGMMICVGRLAEAETIEGPCQLPRSPCGRNGR